ncbi:MAG: hypothetical protein RIC95_11750 [Vicingaceae bacterium]
MRTRQLFSLLLILYTFQVSAQAGDTKAKAFDFWLGEWTVYWYDQDSNKVFGKNRVEKTLDGKVLQEHFSTPNGFKGTSLSVYNPKQKSWHQAWADNQGGYYNFIGIVDNEERIFSTDTSKQQIQRMRFYERKVNSFIWDWERSSDGGQSYQLAWRIYYQRKN